MTRHGTRLDQPVQGPTLSRFRLLALALAALFCCALSPNRAAAQSAQLPAPLEPQPPFVPTRTSTPPTIDGSLDDSVWRMAPEYRDCFEAFPHALAPCPYPARVRVLFDNRALYVGVIALDSEPALIRQHFERRDRLFSPNSDDVLLLYVDATGTAQTAQMFAINPRNNQLDGFWREADQSEDYTSDFAWSGAASRSPGGWTAEFRIPFSSLRYRPGSRQRWKLVVWRNVIRGDFHQESSARIPNGSNCLMCHAGDLVLTTFPADADGNRLSATPEVTVTGRSVDGVPGDRTDTDGNVGGYLSWQPRAGLVIDGMWHPDFSQVEADNFQPTANNQFALLYPEKRPFFLESKNLLVTPLKAIHSRSITEPRWGTRITQHTRHGAFTALVGQDQGGGSVIEPSALSSSLVPQPGRSLAGIGRYERNAGRFRLGGVMTWRDYRNGGHNLVVGPDAVWTGSADRVRMQALYASTQNPDRADLYPTWTGQSLHDFASYADWSHSTATWAWQASCQHLGENFRAWNGFFPQVGVNQYSAGLGYGFYPQGWINNVAPSLNVSRTVDRHGNIVTQSIAPSVTINGGQSSNLVVTVYPADRQLTERGLQHLRYATMSFSSNPGARFTYLSGSLRYGEDVDYLTGDKGTGPQLSVNVQVYPTDRLELDLVGSYQRLNADSSRAASNRLFSERIWQVKGLWFFRSDLYLELSAQTDAIDRNQANYAMPVQSNERSSIGLAMLAYEPTPRTHFYLGMRRSTAKTAGQGIADARGTQFFVKAAYEVTP